jgi:hypothetical protein
MRAHGSSCRLGSVSQGSLTKPRNTLEHWNTTQLMLKLFQVDGCDDAVRPTWWRTAKSSLVLQLKDGTDTRYDNRGSDDSSGAACHEMGCRTRPVPGGKAKMDAALAFSTDGKAARRLSTVGGGGSSKVHDGPRRTGPLLRASSNWWENRAGARPIHATSHYFGNLPGVPDPSGRLTSRRVWSAGDEARWDAEDEIMEFLAS